jgi:hypothetical protein
MLNLHKLFADVFDPQPGETALVLVDLPHGALTDTLAWEQRRRMAERWHAALTAFGRQRDFRTLPLTTFPATGSHNAPLPDDGEQSGARVHLLDLAARTTLVLAMTEFSPSGPLIAWTQRFPRLRAASMPLVAPEMDATALAADYDHIARSCARLRERLRGVSSAAIRFSNGDVLTLDIRFREPHVDDGQLHPGKAPPRLVNLPSGEVYIALYEGERPGEPSRTQGILPIAWRGFLLRLEIAGNCVTNVLGDGAAADDLRAFLALDPARRNVAELGLGCNPQARVTGNVLEDEKAGPHIALGRSEHIGGITGPDAFGDPRHIWHFDFVFAHASPIQIAEMLLRRPDGQETLLVHDGRYSEELDIGM